MIPSDQLPPDKQAQAETANNHGYLKSIIDKKTSKGSKREVIKQRDGSILVIDFDQYNQLISQKEYKTNEELQQDDSDEETQLLAERMTAQATQQPKQEPNKLPEAAGKGDNLEIIRNR
jgi:hypothetical protein